APGPTRTRRYTERRRHPRRHRPPRCRPRSSPLPRRRPHPPTAPRARPIPPRTATARSRFRSGRAPPPQRARRRQLRGSRVSTRARLAFLSLVLGLRQAHRPSGRALRKREHGQHTAELRVAAEILVCADRAEAFGRTLEPRRHADAGPAADAGQNADVLPAVTLPRVDVADDARRRLEAVTLLAALRIDGPQVPLERAVEHVAPARRERTAPDRE